MVQQWITKETGIQEFITFRSEKKYTAQFQGPHREGKAECRQREAGPGVHAFISCLIRVYR